MNEKERKAVELAEHIRDSEKYTVTSKGDMVYGLLRMALALDAHCKELDEIWFDLMDQESAG